MTLAQTAGPAVSRRKRHSPRADAFLSPNVAEILVHKFGIGGITNVEEDMKRFLGA
jgi:hydroxylamine reductase (hybrid-cluster protein)